MRCMRIACVTCERAYGRAMMATMSDTELLLVSLGCFATQLYQKRTLIIKMAETALEYFKVASGLSVGPVSYNGEKCGDGDLKIEFHGEKVNWTKTDEGNGDFTFSFIGTGAKFSSYGQDKRHYLGVSESENKLFACWDANLGYDKYKWKLQTPGVYINKKYELKEDAQPCAIKEA